MPHDPHLAAKMRDALSGRPGIVEKKMFGGCWWMLNGNMLCGVGVGQYKFRVGKDLEAEALAKPGASAMTMKARAMPGMIQVDADTAHEAGLDTWIDFATRFVGTLPAK